MELRVLEYFLAVAREGSVSAAAKSLHLSQPTLSRQLKSLEEELEKELFIRGNRQITLTEDGLLLRRRSEEILNMVEKTKEELNDSGKNLSGDIYIGGGETDAMRIVAQTAKELLDESPDVRFHLFSGNADDVTERLGKGLIDFGVFIEPADKQKYDFIQLPAVDTWGMLMRKDSPLAKQKYITPEDILDLPLLVSRQTQVSNEFSGWLGQDFGTLNIVSTYNLLYNASLMVEEGVGYALGLDKLIDTSENSQLCFRPLEPNLEAHLNIVWKKHQVLSPAAKRFLELMQLNLAAS